jgi:hypothetical protein
MKSLLAIAAGASLLLLATGGILAQQKQRASPHEEVSWTLNGKKITVIYGRPYKKGRNIFGGLEPFGKVWRTGADEATVFRTEGDLMLADTHVVKGDYSLFTIPNEKEWTLILNKTVKQWGAFKYEQSADYCRAAMKVEKLSVPVEQLTIDLVKKGADAGELQISWDSIRATIPIHVH